MIGSTYALVAIFGTLMASGPTGSEAQSEERVKKDRGSATVTIGDTVWKAERCRPKLKGEALKLSCSRTDVENGKTSRQSIDLTIDQFTGPGEYKANFFSMFVGVGFDMETMKAAEGDDAATTKVATDAIQGSKTIRLAGATIVIETVTDDAIDGTFSMPAQGRSPALSDGRFHAVFRKK